MVEPDLLLIEELKDEVEIKEEPEEEQEQQQQQQLQERPSVEDLQGSQPQEPAAGPLVTTPTRKK
jgi:hypothetical protein